ncbi:MAG: bacillopeptidase [Micromonosporaceae bacterium]
MRVRVACLAGAVGLALLAGAPAASASPADLPGAAPVLDPSLREALARTGPTAMVGVVAVLRSQLDPSTVRVPGRAGHLAALERGLRARAGASQRPLLADLAAARARHLVTRVEPLWIIDAVAITATPAVVRRIAARPDVREVRPDLTLRAPPAPGPGVPAARVRAATVADAPAEPNLAQINAPAMWALGFRGQGTVVASLDTGVDVTHPDLAGRWRGGTNSWFDPNGQHPATPTDVNGHGTATMGVMVGGDAGGTAIGVAPDARWIAVKIFNDRGVATATTVHRGLQWLLDPDGDPATADAPDVVNNSWTFAAGGCNRDFQLDLANLRAAGILPVFAAGNSGPTAGTIGNPATNPEAFAVGSVDAADAIDPSSGRGPSPCGEPVAPALAAPGVDVLTTDLYGLYVYATGTSVAAPHVAGALALLRCAQPGLPAERQSAALTGGAVDLGPPGGDSTYGYGRLDALAAYRWLSTAPDYLVSVAPATASTTAGGSVTYAVSVSPVNGFTGDVTLGLTGLSAAQGRWSATPTVVTGGAGTATVTVTAAALAPGTYPLTVTAQSGTAAHGATARLVVTPPPDFTVSASPATLSLTRRQSGAVTVSVGSVAGFAGTVALSAGGLPAGSTAGWSADPVPAPGSATLTVSTASGTPRGTFTVLVTATAGSRTHQATVTLTVR